MPRQNDLRASGLDVTVRQLVGQLAEGTQLLSLEPPRISEQLAQLAKALHEQIRDVEGGLVNDERKADSETRALLDELDKAGAEFYNAITTVRNRLYHGSNGDQAPAQSMTRLRFLAFKVIKLGARVPYQPQTHSQLLSLSSKAAQDLLDASDVANCREVLSEGADHCAALLSATDFSTTDRQTLKHVVLHYCLRIKVETQSGHYAIAGFVKTQVQSLLPKLSDKERLKVAATAYEVGSLSTANTAELEAKEAIAWLHFALQIAEGHDDERFNIIKINALKALARTFIDAAPARSQWDKAEECISQLLRLEPTSSLARRRLKLVIARSGRDEEIFHAVEQAAELALKSGGDETSLLLREVHRIAERSIQFQHQVFERLARFAVGRIDTNSDTFPAAVDFLALLLLAAVLRANTLDATRFVKLLSAVEEVAPELQLPADPSFCIVIQLWRLADKLFSDRDYAQAAALYHAGVHSLFAEVKASTWSKSLRKVAMCHIELKQYGEALSAAQRALDLDSSAKGHLLLLRIYIRQHNSRQSFKALGTLLSSAAFSPQMLLWAAQEAHDSGQHALLAPILEKLLVICRDSPSPGIEVDMMTLTRCLIRIASEFVGVEGTPPEQLALLLQQYEIAREVAHATVKGKPDDDTLVKSITWLHKTGFNLCIQLGADVDQGVLTRLLDIVADLMELETSLVERPDAVTLANLLRCRIASLAEKVAAAKLAEEAHSEKPDPHQDFVSQLAALRALYERVSRDSSSVFFDTDHKIGQALAAFEIDIWSSMGEWEEAANCIKSLIESIQSVPVKTLKMLARRVVDEEQCPPTAAHDILQTTLKVLFSRQELDVVSLASWLRMMVQCLLTSRPNDALSYVSKAASFIANLREAYPDDESRWLSITSWDRGLDFFACRDTIKGQQWCSAAVQIARCIDGAFAEKLERDLTELLARYPVVENDSDDQQNGDVEMQEV